MRHLILLMALAASGLSAAELPTATAVEREIKAEHRLDGVVEAVHRATVSAQTSGRIIELPFDVDDYVEKGEIIVQFRATEQKARFNQAEAGLAEAQARYAEAAAELQRIEKIYAERLVSRSELDRARANFDAARARLESARAAVAAAREELEQTRVRAPYSGIVLERHVEVGELATVGQPLMTGVSLEELRVVVQVPQSLISDVRKNRKARVSMPDGTILESTSLRIYPYADEKTHTFRVRINLSSGQHGVYPGMLVKARFAADSETVLTVPETAIARRGEVTAVYVRDKSGELHFRHIRTGRVYGETVQVLAGLAAGETVVTDPVAAARVWKAQAEQSTRKSQQG